MSLARKPTFEQQLAAFDAKCRQLEGDIAELIDKALTREGALEAAGLHRCRRCRKVKPALQMYDDRCLVCVVDEDFPQGMESTR